jgi:hypothetical protein
MIKGKLGRFLGTFTAYTQAVSAYVPQGINEANIAYARVVVPNNMASGDTLAITIPPGQDPGLIPAELYFPSMTPSGGTPPTGAQTYGSGVQVVSHNVTTGVTTVKPAQTGSLALNDEILLEYIGGE